MPLVISLAGAPRERGRVYGETARELIAEAAARWQRAVAAGRPTLIDSLLHSGFRETAGRLTPWLVEEVEGIAEGADVDPRLVWALNLLDESWWLGRASGAATGCSTLAVRAGSGHPTLVGQNMDLPSWVEGLHVLLDIRPDDGSPRVLAPAYAGIVATYAIGHHGLGVAVNALSQMPTSRTGLPVAFVIRLLAIQPSAAAAAEVLRGLPHASGQNYL